MTNNDIKKIGEEMERVVEPIYDELEKINLKLDKQGKTLVEHTDKIDALITEVHDVHLELGGYKDKTDSEIDKIKEQISLTSPRS